MKNCEEIFEVVRLCRDAGIQQVYGNIILGGANFTQETFEADKEFVRALLEESQGVVEIGVVTFWPLAETKMTRCPEDFGIKICDADFLTSVGDFPQVETSAIDRLALNDMRREFEEVINAQMVDMLENWRVPTERVLSWFPPSRNAKSYGGWFKLLTGQEILFSYYEMLKLGEGLQAAQTENLSAAHPLRVVQLSRHLRRIDATTAEICGERLSGVELEILLLSTGKLSVEEISLRVEKNLDAVQNVLNRLEQKHLIVYSLH